ncbi:sugar phosphate isomerase/epimerase [bacterium]|nr:sugar phosphate isomerase/epimerase [bacterium]
MRRIIIGGRAHDLDQVRDVCSLGFPFAEISLDDPMTVENNLDELLKIKEHFGITYLAHYPNEGNPFDADKLKKDFVPKIKRLLDLSRELGISKATIHFWMDRRWASEELILRKIGLLSEMVFHADGQGVVICIENLSERVESFMRAFDAIPNLRMTLDIGHAQLLASRNTSFEFIRHVLPRIAHVHVHDNHGGTSVKDDQHLPIGDGIIDYPAIMKELINGGYNSTITMEVKPPDMRKTEEILNKFLTVS